MQSKNNIGDILNSIYDEHGFDGLNVNYFLNKFQEISTKTNSFDKIVDQSSGNLVATKYGPLNSTFPMSESNCILQMKYLLLKNCQLLLEEKTKNQDGEDDGDEDQSKEKQQKDQLDENDQFSSSSGGNNNSSNNVSLTNEVFLRFLLDLLNDKNEILKLKAFTLAREFFSSVSVGSMKDLNDSLVNEAINVFISIIKNDKFSQSERLDIASSLVSLVMAKNDINLITKVIKLIISFNFITNYPNIIKGEFNNFLPLENFNFISNYHYSYSLVKDEETSDYLKNQIIYNLEQVYSMIYDNGFIYLHCNLGLLKFKLDLDLQFILCKSKTNYHINNNNNSNNKDDNKDDSSSGSNNNNNNNRSWMFIIDNNIYFRSLDMEFGIVSVIDKNSFEESFMVIEDEISPLGSHPYSMFYDQFTKRIGILELPSGQSKSRIRYLKIIENSIISDNSNGKESSSSSKTTTTTHLIQDTTDNFDLFDNNQSIELVNLKIKNIESNNISNLSNIKSIYPSEKGIFYLTNDNLLFLVGTNGFIESNNKPKFFKLPGDCKKIRKIEYSSPDLFVIDQNGVIHQLVVSSGSSFKKIEPEESREFVDIKATVSHLYGLTTTGSVISFDRVDTTKQHIYQKDEKLPIEKLLPTPKGLFYQSKDNHFVYYSNISNNNMKEEIIDDNGKVLYDKFEHVYFGFSNFITIVNKNSLKVSEEVGKAKELKQEEKEDKIGKELNNNCNNSCDSNSSVSNNEEEFEIHVLGENSFGQLGLGNFDDAIDGYRQLKNYPFKIQGTKFYIGLTFTLALTSDHKLYYSGNIKSLKPTNVFTILQESNIINYETERIIQVSVSEFGFALLKERFPQFYYRNNFTDIQVYNDQQYIGILIPPSVIKSIPINNYQYNLFRKDTMSLISKNNIKLQFNNNQKDNNQQQQQQQQQNNNNILINSSNLIYLSNKLSIYFDKNEISFKILENQESSNLPFHPLYILKSNQTNSQITSLLMLLNSIHQINYNKKQAQSLLSLETELKQFTFPSINSNYYSNLPKILFESEVNVGNRPSSLNDQMTTFIKVSKPILINSLVFPKSNKMFTPTIQIFSNDGLSIKLKKKQISYCYQLDTPILLSPGVQYHILVICPKHTRVIFYPLPNITIGTVDFDFSSINKVSHVTNLIGFEFTQLPYEPVKKNKELIYSNSGGNNKLNLDGFKNLFDILQTLIRQYQNFYELSNIPTTISNLELNKNEMLNIISEIISNISSLLCNNINLLDLVNNNNNNNNSGNIILSNSTINNNNHQLLKEFTQFIHQFYCNKIIFNQELEYNDQIFKQLSPLLDSVYQLFKSFKYIYSSDKLKVSSVPLLFKLVKILEKRNHSTIQFTNRINDEIPGIKYFFASLIHSFKDYLTSLPIDQAHLLMKQEYDIEEFTKESVDPSLSSFYDMISSLIFSISNIQKERDYQEDEEQLEINNGKESQSSSPILLSSTTTLNEEDINFIKDKDTFENILLKISSLPLQQQVEDQLESNTHNQFNNYKIESSSIIQWYLTSFIQTISPVVKNKEAVIHEVDRFPNHKSCWSYSGHSVDGISFSCDKDIYVRGIGVFGDKGRYSCQTSYRYGESGGDFNINPVVFTSWVNNSSDHIEQIYFEKEIFLKRGQFLTVFVKINGGQSSSGTGGKSKVVYQDFVFNFREGNIKGDNGTSINSGQIPFIYFSTQKSNSVSRKPRVVYDKSSSIFTSLVLNCAKQQLLQILRLLKSDQQQQFIKSLTSDSFFQKILPISIDLLVNSTLSQDVVNQSLLPLFEIVSKLNHSIKGYKSSSNSLSSSISSNGNNSPNIILNNSNNGGNSNIQLIRVESSHPYEETTKQIQEISFPESTKWMVIQFDSRSITCQKSDVLFIYNDHIHQNLIKSNGFSKKFPSNSLIVPGNKLSFNFSTASSPANVQPEDKFGFACNVYGFDILPSSQFKNYSNDILSQMVYPLHTVENQLAFYISISSTNQLFGEEEEENDSSPLVYKPLFSYLKKVEKDKKDANKNKNINKDDDDDDDDEEVKASSSSESDEDDNINSDSDKEEKKKNIIDSDSSNSDSDASDNDEDKLKKKKKKLINKKKKLVIEGMNLDLPISSFTLSDEILEIENGNKDSSGSNDDNNGDKSDQSNNKSKYPFGCRSIESYKSLLYYQRVWNRIKENIEYNPSKQFKFGEDQENIINLVNNQDINLRFNSQDFINETSNTIGGNLAKFFNTVGLQIDKSSTLSLEEKKDQVKKKKEDIKEDDNKEDKENKDEKDQDKPKSKLQLRYEKIYNLFPIEKDNILQQQPDQIIIKVNNEENEASSSSTINIGTNNGSKSSKKEMKVALKRINSIASYKKGLKRIMDKRAKDFKNELNKIKKEEIEDSDYSDDSSSSSSSSSESEKSDSEIEISSESESELNKKEEKEDEIKVNIVKNEQEEEMKELNKDKTQTKEEKDEEKQVSTIEEKEELELGDDEKEDQINKFETPLKIPTEMVSAFIKQDEFIKCLRTLFLELIRLNGAEEEFIKIINYICNNSIDSNNIDFKELYHISTFEPILELWRKIQNKLNAFCLSQELDTEIQLSNLFDDEDNQQDEDLPEINFKKFNSFINILSNFNFKINKQDQERKQQRQNQIQQQILQQSNSLKKSLSINEDINNNNNNNRRSLLYSFEEFMNSNNINQSTQLLNINNENKSNNQQLQQQSQSQSQSLSSSSTPINSSNNNSPILKSSPLIDISNIFISKIINSDITKGIISLFSDNLIEFDIVSFMKKQKNVKNQDTSNIKVLAMNSICKVIERSVTPSALENTIWLLASSLHSKQAPKESLPDGWQGKVAQNPIKTCKISEHSKKDFTNAFHTLLETLSEKIKNGNYSDSIILNSLFCFSIFLLPEDIKFVQNSEIFPMISTILSEMHTNNSITIEQKELQQQKYDLNVSTPLLKTPINQLKLNTSPLIIASPKGKEKLIETPFLPPDINLLSPSSLFNSSSNNNNNNNNYLNNNNSNNKKILDKSIKSTSYINIGNKLRVQLSKNPEMLGSLFDESTNSFWEAPSNSSITITMDPVKSIHQISFYIDNTSNENSVSLINWKAEQEDNEQLMGSINLPNISSWFSIPFNGTVLKSMVMTFIGTESIRVRQLKVMVVDPEKTNQTMKNYQISKFDSTLSLLKLLTFQIFGISNDNKKISKNLKGHIENLLSVSGVSSIQKQIFSLISNEVQKEIKHFTKFINLSTSGGELLNESSNELLNELSDNYLCELLTTLLTLFESEEGKSFIPSKSMMFSLLSIIQNGTDKTQHLIISICRLMIVNIKPTIFDEFIKQEHELSTFNNNDCNNNFGQFLLLCIAKSISVQVKANGSLQTTEFKLDQSAHLIKGLEGSVNLENAQDLVLLLKSLISRSSSWKEYLHSTIKSILLGKIRKEFSQLSSINLLNSSYNLWMGLACLLVVQDDDEFIKLLNGYQSETIIKTCQNHDDGVTEAFYYCPTCQMNLCNECDRFLHLSKKNRDHSRSNLDNDSFTIEVRESCVRMKISSNLVVVDKEKHKAIIQTVNNYSADQCRYCKSKLESHNLLPYDGITGVCSNEECRTKASKTCIKLHSCGHNCFGIRNEEECLQCLHGCEKISSSNESSLNNKKLSQDVDDMCMICWTEGLTEAPSIQLDCGHVFHYDCTKNLLEARWSGSRITFGFAQCPICKVSISHKALKPITDVINNIRDEIIKKGKMRIEYQNMNNDPLLLPGGRYENRIEDFIMDQFSYYLCFKCKQPYFGGLNQCAAGINQININHEELVCGGCSAGDNPSSICPKHGKDYLEFKCRYCCSVAIWFCFGTTHFCETCHNNHGTLADRKKHPQCPVGPGGIELSSDVCPLKLKSGDHPPTGTEFCLGCSLCYNHNSF